VLDVCQSNAMLVCLAASSSSTVMKVRLVVHDWRRWRQATPRTQQRSGEWRLLMCHPYRTDGRESIWSIDRVWASSSPEHGALAQQHLSFIRRRQGQS
jgi:hypothetical protein